MISSFTLLEKYSFLLLLAFYFTAVFTLKELIWNNLKKMNGLFDHFPLLSFINTEIMSKNGTIFIPVI